MNKELVIFAGNIGTGKSLWTCRSGDYLDQMRKFLIDNSIPYDFINENPMVNFGSPKIYANKYYDDRNA